MLSELYKPCGIFWDIENVDVPRNCAADVIAQNIRATLVFPNQLVERDFFCVCNVHQLPKPVGTSLESIGVTIVQPFYNVKENAADTKILLLITKFIQNWGRNGCAIVVVTGDSDFLDPLLKLKLNHDLTVYLIHPKQSFSKELLWSADFSYQLEGVLLIETSPTSIFRSKTRSGFLKVYDLPQDSESHRRIHEINRHCSKFLNGSRILRIAKGTVWIGFTNPSLSMTENDYKTLASFFQVSNISPKLELVKSLWPESGQKIRHKQPKNDEHILKGVNLKNADNQIRASVPVFQEIKPSSPRKKLSKCSNKRRAASQPATGLSQKEVDFRSLRKKIICLTGSPNSELTTNWSLMYNIVDKSLDHNIQKVILQGKDFWLQFGDEIKCKQLADKLIADSSYLNPLVMKRSISPSKKLIAIISSYPSDNPFCLNLNLGLNYLKSSNSESFTEPTANRLVEKIKNVSVSFKCVFVKLFEGIIWAGFPSIRTCENAKKKINSLKDDKLHMQSAQIRLFPVHLFESIGMKDFVGETQDLIRIWMNKNCTLSSSLLFALSTSIESTTDSSSVISEKIDASRHNVPCSSEVDGKSSSTYMETVSSVHGYFLQIRDILKLQKKRLLRKPFFIQSLVDFVGIVPKAAILENDSVYFNYNTFDEVKRAIKVVESKLYDNVHHLEAISISEAPSNWLKTKKYYFGLPRVPPQPPKKSITYICITPAPRKEIKAFTSILLAALQSFYVYFIRHYSESSWVGIGSQEQAEKAVENFKESNLLDSKLDIKIVKKLPKDFWKTAKEDKQSPNETSEASAVSISKAQRENGSMKSLSEFSSTSTISSQKISVKNGSFSHDPFQTIPYLGSPSKPVVVSHSNSISSLTFGSAPISLNGVKNGPEKPFQFMIETKEKLEPILNSQKPRNTVQHPLPNAPAKTISPPDTEKLVSTNLNGSSYNQLMQKLLDSFHYLMISSPNSFISDEALSHLKRFLTYAVLIKRLTGSILAVFDNPNKRAWAKERIHGYSFVDEIGFGNCHIFTAKFVDKAPEQFVESLSRPQVYELWRYSKVNESIELNTAQTKPASNIERNTNSNSFANFSKTSESQTQTTTNTRSIPTYAATNTKSIPAYMQPKPTSSYPEKNKKKNCVVS